MGRVGGWVRETANARQIKNLNLLENSFLTQAIPGTVGDVLLIFSSKLLAPISGEGTWEMG